MGRLALLLPLLLTIGACAAFRPLPPEAELGPSVSVELAAVPFYPQARYHCGPAALASVLQHTGVAASPETLAPEIYVPGRQGSFREEVAAAARRRGRVVLPMAPNLAAIVAALSDGRPVLVFQNLGPGWYPRWHFAVVVGYDAATDEMILRSGTERRHLVSRETFFRTWDRGQRWARVVSRPSDIPAIVTPLPWLRAAHDLEQAGQQQAASEAYAAGLRRWPDHAGLRLALANRHALEGRTGDAIRVLQGGLAFAPSSALLNNLAWLLMEAGRYDQAAVHAEAAVALGGPFATQARATLAEIRCRQSGGCKAGNREEEQGRTS